MNSINNSSSPESTKLAEYFIRFCRDIDHDINETALLAIKTLVNRNVQYGDTCLDLHSLSEHDSTETNHARNTVDTQQVNHLIAQLKISSLIGKPDDNPLLILDGNRLYLHRHWDEEQIISHQLQSRMTIEPVDSDRLHQQLNNLFGTSTPEKRERTLGQKIAAAMTLSSRLSIIAGGPGTGKTTTVTKILALLLEQEPTMRILLAAPTGKAAARLAESIDEQVLKIEGNIDQNILDQLPRQASTIHRLLGWNTRGFQYNADNLLPVDCLLLDETSMVDQGLMASLLQALPETCRLILLGDRDQLESVEAGKVLGDITGHGQPLTLSDERARQLATLLGETPPVEISENTPDIANYIAHLSYSHRFAGGGGIGKLATAVNNSEAENAITLLTDNDPETTLIEITGKNPNSKIIDWACERYAPIFTTEKVEQALDIFESSRVLTALRQGDWGETVIGEQIEARLRKQKVITAGNNTVYKGLPIIIRQNDRETGLFNGDTGIFWFEQDDIPVACFRINGELQYFTTHLLPQWQPAWTLTVHRSQGSQYEQVMLILPAERSPVVTRELIYTGLTRAQKHCTIVTRQEAFKLAIKSREPRHSGLADRLGWSHML